MGIVVKANNVRKSYTKVMKVCDLIRNKPVFEAIKILRFCDRKETAILLTKLVNSGLDIASQTKKYDLENLVIKRLIVNQGPTMKRIRPRAQGRAFRVRHRSSYITLEIDEAL